MPELPEVEVVRRGLATHAVGATISAVEVLHPRPVRRDPGGPTGFIASLTGQTITAAHRRGKYLWLPLDSGDAVLGHLGMSGQMLVQPPGALDERHLRVRLHLTGAGGDRQLRFVDQRMFGGLATSLGGAELPPEIAHIARDLLDPDFDIADFVRRVRRRSSGVKRVLLDQTLVSGVGNIYADEALWRARIHGERRGDRLTAKQVRELAGHARDVMIEALDQGGTSFDALYVNVNGQSGTSQKTPNVYGRKVHSCNRRGTWILRVCFLGRSSQIYPVYLRKRSSRSGQRTDKAAPTGVRTFRFDRLHVNVYPLRHGAPDIEPGRAARMSTLNEAEHGHRAGLRTPRGEDNA